MRLWKIVLVIAIVLLAWKVVLPWLKERGGSFSSATATSETPCVASAQRASDVWGNGIGKFVNPPYDMDAWSKFKSRVNDDIAEAESDCSDSGESNDKAKAAMGDLRTLVSDLDVAITNGSAPPGDIVQRQESIDNRISEAQELVRAGK